MGTITNLNSFKFLKNEHETRGIHPINVFLYKNNPIYF